MNAMQYCIGPISYVSKMSSAEQSTGAIIFFVIEASFSYFACPSMEKKNIEKKIN